MTTIQLRAAIFYLKSIIAINPKIDARNMGECIYCGAALDEGKPHLASCHYLEAQRLLEEFKATLKQSGS